MLNPELMRVVQRHLRIGLYVNDRVPLASMEFVRIVEAFDTIGYRLR